MPFVSVNDINLYYKVVGLGDPVVFIHGLGSSSRDWESQIPYFAEKYQVIVFDLRGHGQSEKPAGPYTIPMFAKDLNGLLAVINTKPAHVVGISLGGAVAFQFALDFPQRIKSLTIVNSAPSLGGTPEQASQEIERRIGIVQKYGMRAMGQNLAPGLFPLPEQTAQRDAFIENWAENDPAAYMEATRSMLGWDVTQQLKNIRCAVCIIASDQDYSSVAIKEAYVKLLSNSRLEVIPNAHHAIPIENPRNFNSALDRFLSSPAAG